MSFATQDALSRTRLSRVKQLTQAVALILDPEARRQLTRLHNDRERDIKELEDMVVRLRSELALASENASRPSTTASVIDARAAHQDYILARTPNDDSLDSIPQHIAERYINQYHTSTDPLLGCWLSSNHPSHSNGYTRVNLRNARGPAGQPINYGQPYLHHLAFVAAGDRDRLIRRTGEPEYQVSHLCHNGACFKREHLVIESKELNLVKFHSLPAYLDPPRLTSNYQARNSCQGAVVFRHNNLTWNPCVLTAEPKVDKLACYPQQICLEGAVTL